jgi:hypothetical protein
MSSNSAAGSPSYNVWALPSGKLVGRMNPASEEGLAFFPSVGLAVAPRRDGWDHSPMGGSLRTWSIASASRTDDLYVPEGTDLLDIRRPLLLAHRYDGGYVVFDPRDASRVDLEAVARPDGCHASARSGHARFDGDAANYVVRRGSNLRTARIERGAPLERFRDPGLLERFLARK